MHEHRIEHRLNQLEEMTRDTGSNVQKIQVSVSRIESAMVTKGQIFVAAMGLLGGVIVAVISVAAHWLLRQG